MVACVGEALSVGPERRTSYPEGQSLYLRGGSTKNTVIPLPTSLGDYTPYDLPTACLVSGEQSVYTLPLSPNECSVPTMEELAHPPYGVFSETSWRIS